MSDRDEQLRQRAYGIWQAEGEPHGRDREHWEKAERELTEVAEQDPPETIAAEPVTATPPAAPGNKAETAPQTIAAENVVAKPKTRKPRSAKSV